MISRIWLVWLCGAWLPALAAGFLKDISKETKLEFTHFNGMAGGYHLPEVMSGGVAFFDYDLDGDLDVYLVQSNLIGPGADMAKAHQPFKGKGQPMDRLLRNDLTKGPDGKAVITWVDVTEASGIRATGYGMGVASGDVNNDGYPDLYVTNLGANQLWINNGDGTFSDRTEAANAGDNRWSTSAAFIDYDRDGWLDLYIANYVVYDAANEPECFTARSSRDYCGPQAYPPDRDALLRNKGDGTFEDAGKRLLSPAAGPGLGVASLDADNDGDLDLYVANDGRANFLWINNGTGFTDEGLLSGVALNAVGSAEAGMGVAVGDFDEDGDEDLFVTHLMDETNTLYVNEGNLFFEDRTNQAGLGTPSRRFTAFGTQFFDADNDGYLDLITLNGAVSFSGSAAEGDVWKSLLEPNQLFMNKNGKFSEVQDPALTSAVYLSRGAAFGDVDNDGDTDILITNTAGPARLLANQSSANWIGFRLTHAKYKRDMLGSLVVVTTADGKTHRRRARTDGSYIASSDPRVLIGLGKQGKVAKVAITWPDGSEQTLEKPAINRYHHIVQESAQ